MTTASPCFLLRTVTSFEPHKLMRKMTKGPEGNLRGMTKIKENVTKQGSGVGKESFALTTTTVQHTLCVTRLMLLRGVPLDHRVKAN